MMWDITNSILRLILMGLAVVAITKYRHMFLRDERVGLGIMGGCAFLTIGVIWERQNSPFDGWATSLFTFGAVLFLNGLLRRKSRHDRANEAQLKVAEAWMKGRGR